MLDSSILIFDKEKTSGLELGIIEKIISDPLTFITDPITELAKKYFVSEATITRTVKHLGFNNIKHLKMHLYERINNFNRNYQINEINDLQGIANTMRVYYSYSIHETIDSIDFNMLESLIQDIIDKKRIFVFGIGSSYLACRVFHSNLNMIGYNCFTTENIHSLMVTLQNVDEKDLLVIFSKSGKTNEILNIINLANEMKLDIALITANPKPSENFNIKHQIIFKVHAKENSRFPALSSKVVQIMISDIIFRAILKENPELEEKVQSANRLTEKWNHGHMKF